jgi:hypothetical protein
MNRVRELENLCAWLVLGQLRLRCRRMQQKPPATSSLLMEPRDAATVGDEHGPSKFESSFNRMVESTSHRVAFPDGNPRNGDMARRLEARYPVLPWHNNAFGRRDEM